ncbi:MAG: signal peptidase I [Clostridia bacterium]|nr:signal peptidase I [Clostridia bacterium]
MQDNDNFEPQQENGEQAGTWTQAIRDRREKKRQKQAAKPKKTIPMEILSWVLTILAALAIAFVVRTFLAEPVRVQGESMDDTLANGEIMFVGKTSFGSRWLTLPWQTDEQKEAAPRFAYFGDPSLFDVVICRYPHRGDQNFVKRVVGKPGDRVALADGYLLVNGERYAESYINDDYRTGSGETYDEVTVPRRGDTVTLSDDTFTLNGADYACGYTLLRVAGEGGEYKLRKVFGSADGAMWVRKDGALYRLERGVWFRQATNEEIAANAWSARTRYQYPNEPTYDVYLVVSDSPMPDGDYTVQADYYFLMGDHRDSSNDSRYIGAVERTCLIGTVRQVIWPLGGWRPIRNGLNAN